MFSSSLIFSSVVNLNCSIYYLFHFTYCIFLHRISFWSYIIFIFFFFFLNTCSICIIVILRSFLSCGTCFCWLCFILLLFCFFLLLDNFLLDCGHCKFYTCFLDFVGSFLPRAEFVWYTVELLKLSLILSRLLLNFLKEGLEYSLRLI